MNPTQPKTSAAREAGQVRARLLCLAYDGMESLAEAYDILANEKAALLAICQEIANSGCDLGNSERRIRLYAAITKAGGAL